MTRIHDTTRLGEILIQHGFASRSQVEQVIREVGPTGRRLGEALIERGVLTDEQLARALAIQAEMSYVASFSPEEVDTDLAQRIQMQDMVDLKFIPLRGNRVAICDPSKTPQIASIIEAALGTTSDLDFVVTTEGAVSYLISQVLTHESKAAAGDANARDTLFGIVLKAHRLGASDIHLIPKTDGYLVRYRVDGHFTPRAEETLAKALGVAVVNLIFNYAQGLNTGQRARGTAHDGSWDARIQGIHIPLRVSVIPVEVSGEPYMESVVMRLLTSQQKFKSLADLGLSPTAQAALGMAKHRKNGLILVTGPTESGKTTTVYALLDEIRKQRGHEVDIATIEDPVEIRVDWAKQIPAIRDDHARRYREEGKRPPALPMMEALQVMLRHDPNIIFFGEIRDPDTARATIHAARTGHLVISTLHTKSAGGTIRRLLDLGISIDSVADVLVCVVHQELAPVPCSHCAQRGFLPESLARVYAHVLRSEGVSEDEIAALLQRQFLFPQVSDCAHCAGSGFAGRIPLNDVIVWSHEIHRRLTSGDIECLRSHMAFEALLAAAEGKIGAAHLLGYVDPEVAMLAQQ
ncbi:MAG: general secretion pathway protein GspE [Nitrospiraceae bacterium]|nr:MAG: general secretion pathway protein GspE [Nitrospiraceae bacterium]